MLSLLFPPTHSRNGQGVVGLKKPGTVSETDVESDKYHFAGIEGSTDKTFPCVWTGLVAKL